MNPIVDEVKREYGGKVEFEYVSMDDQPGKDKAAEYGVIGYPNLLILTSEGKEYELLKGVVPKQALAQSLDGVLAQEGE
jgi:thioredoxin-like negative regulator of GroEL